MKINGNAVRVGNVVEHQGRLWVVTKTQAVKPGKGGAFNQVEMKDIRTGTKLNERFRADEQVELVRLEQRLQGLENSRALDRTSVLEEQQRAMVGRLQTLEGGAQRLEALERQQEQWRSSLADMQGRAVRRPQADPDLFPAAAPPSSSPGGRPSPPLSDRGDGGVLRPPAPGSP